MDQSCSSFRDRAMNRQERQSAYSQTRGGRGGAMRRCQVTVTQGPITTDRGWTFFKV